MAGTSAVGGSGSAGSAGSAKSSSRVRDRDSLNAVLRLERKGLRVTSRLTSDDDDCVTHSHGQVQDFFREQPCAALFRVLIEVRDKRRNVVLVAIAWVDMPASSGARQLKELVDANGTGNVTALSRERGRYRHVRFTGEYYESVREATTVVNAQAQPVGRTAGAVALAEIVASAVR